MSRMTVALTLLLASSALMITEKALQAADFGPNSSGCSGTRFHLDGHEPSRGLCTSGCGAGVSRALLCFRVAADSEPVTGVVFRLVGQLPATGNIRPVVDIGTIAGDGVDPSEMHLNYNTTYHTYLEGQFEFAEPLVPGSGPATLVLTYSTADLSDDLVQFRVRLSDGTWGGFCSAPLQLLPPATAVDDGARRPDSPVLLTSISPNPATAFVRVALVVPDNGPTQVAIHDLRGALVRLLMVGSFAPGPREAIWDGRDTNGRAVVSGVYFCRVAAGDRTEVRKILVLE